MCGASSVVNHNPGGTSPSDSDCPLTFVAGAANRSTFDNYLSCVDDRTVYEGERLARLLPAARFPAGSTAGLDGSAGLLRADRCLLAVRRLFAAGGGEVLDAAPVVDIAPVAGTDGRVLRVSGPAGGAAPVTCRGLVVCAGAWAGRLLAPLGLPRLQRLLQPQKVAVTYWRVRPGASVPLAGIDSGPDQRSSDFYWLPALEYPGLVKVCHSLQHWPPQSRHCLLRDTGRLLFNVLGIQFHLSQFITYV